MVIRCRKGVLYLSISRDAIKQNKAGADQAPALGWRGEIQREGRLFVQRSQAAHQTALTTGSIVLVNDTLLGSRIQRADRLKCRHAGRFGVT